MNGAESLIHTALAAGVEVCFANPGTTEMPLVAALDGGGRECVRSWVCSKGFARVRPTATRG